MPGSSGKERMLFWLEKDIGEKDIGEKEVKSVQLLQPLYWMNPESKPRVYSLATHTQLRNCSAHLGHPSIQKNLYALSLSDWSKTEKALLSAM